MFTWWFLHIHMQPAKALLRVRDQIIQLFSSVGIFDLVCCMITVDFFTQQLYPQQIKPGNGKCLNSKWRSCWNGRPSVYGLQSVFSCCRFQPRHATCVLVFIVFLKHTVHCGFCLSLSLHPTLLASTDCLPSLGFPCSELLNCESQFSHLTRPKSWRIELKKHIMWVKQCH